MNAGWRVGETTIPLDRAVMVGILNVTPDSFSDGGSFEDPEAAVAHGIELSKAGAGIVDVGGESTRPGAVPVDEATELERVLPVVSTLVSEGVLVSIDTMKPRVAEAAIEAGARIVNDVGGLRNPEMIRLVADAGVGLVVMHMQGTPTTMQESPRYSDVVGEVSSFLQARAALAIEKGVDAERIVIDPGIGFGKTVEHNLRILARLSDLCEIGYPVMIGTSRKSFLGLITGTEAPERLDLATAVTVALAFERGARLFRVHDVSSSREATLVAGAIVGSSGSLSGSD